MTDFRAIQATAVALFTDEFRQSLPAILTAVDAMDQDRGNRAAVKEAHRLIHALKGGASMVGLAAFGYLLNVAEELIETSTVGQAPVRDNVVDGLRASMPTFASYMDVALAGQPIESIAVDLAHTLHAAGAPADVDLLRNLIEMEAREIAQFAPDVVETPAQPAEAPSVPLPEPAAEDLEAPSVVEDRFVAPAPAEASVETPTTLEFDVVMTEEVPPELAEVFGEEAREHLETIARLTLRLTSEPEDRESVQELRRSVHTLKGAAGVVGYKGASKLAHRMEDLLDRLYEGSAALTPRGVTA